MLTVNSSEEKNTCFKFIGADSTPKTTHLISNNTSLIVPSMSEGGNDTCSFYSGPSDATIMAFGQSCETAGSIAYSGGETAGSIAYSGCESSGSIASAAPSVSCGGGFSGGSVSFSC